MPSVAMFTDALKRLLVGRPFRSESLSETLLPKRIALPVFASDALSSVAYAPDEIFLTLAFAGSAAYIASPWVGVFVAFVMGVVVMSYRQNVHAYPSGGGDYEVATTNLGVPAGLGVASALLVDYVLTVAVSVSSGAQYASSAIPALREHEATFAVVVVVLLTAVNLRGVRESGTALAVPTYAFMVAILGMAAYGWYRLVAGTLPAVESSELTVVPLPDYEQGMIGLGWAFLLLRAFSSGCAALTGVEAISNGVPAFRRPKSRNAATTLAMLGAIAVVMMLSMIVLAQKMHIRYVEEPATQLLRDGVPVGPDYEQNPVIGQIARALFADVPVIFYFVAAVTGLILVLAANTAFNGFPVLGSILARDNLLPRQLHTRGDRLAFSNGILTLAAGAIALILAFDAEVTKLIQLYIVGVFIAFTLSQAGMVRHWTALLRTETEPAVRRRMIRSRAVNAVGVSVTGLVLIIVMITKFVHGAYLALFAMSCPLPDHARDPQALPGREHRAGGRAGDQGPPAALPRARHRAGVQDPQADAAGPRLRPGGPPVGPGGRDRRDRSGADGGVAAAVGRARRPGPAARTGLAVPGDRPAGGRLRARASAGRALAIWWSSTSRSTWWATGGRTSCTTRVRSGSRPGCATSRGSSWPACPGSCSPPPDTRSVTT